MEIEDIIKDSSFLMLKGKVSDQILGNLKLMGLEKPTRIQAESFPYILLEKDVIGTAKTGSGKTLAFLIPVVERLIKLGFSKKHGTGCIILTPTRELALQIYQVLKKLLVKIALTYSLIVGGEKKAKDLLALKKGSCECSEMAKPHNYFDLSLEFVKLGRVELEASLYMRSDNFLTVRVIWSRLGNILHENVFGVNIVVSTPGRLFDHLENTECFNVKNLKCLVVDEADKLLEAGFEKHVTGIVNLLPRNRQTLLFSATLDNKVKNLARLALREDPVVISTSDQSQSTVSGLKQGYYICPVEQKLSWLYKMLRKSKKLKVMVFFLSCKSVDFHYEFFRNHCKAAVLSIHGRQSQARRKETYHKFVEASSGALFCTDVAARGLDIPSVDWIVQYDPPTDPKEYIHRVGRTARGLNNTGNAVILLRPEEEKFINFLNTDKVYLDKYSFDEPSEDIQRSLEDLILKNGVIKLLARKAYLSFLRCYKAHPLKKIFNINTLDVNLAAKAFGFLETPHNDFLNKPKKSKKQKQNTSS